MRSIIATTAAVVATVTTLDVTEAHQRVIIPAPTFTVADREVNWRPLAYLEAQGVKVGEDIVGYYKSKAKTLREFMDNKATFKVTAAGATFDCGYTDPNGPRQPVPADGMMHSTGYAHEGPCEIWIDDTMVKSGDNCHNSIGAKTVSYKVDFSSCKGDCMLRWYWFGNRLIGGKKRSWQIYKECIPIRGKGGGASSGGKPSGGKGNSTADVGGDNESPVKPTKLPASGSSSKCKAKRG